MLLSVLLCILGVQFAKRSQHVYYCLHLSVIQEIKSKCKASLCLSKSAPFDLVAWNEVFCVRWLKFALFFYAFDNFSYYLNCAESAYGQLRLAYEIDRSTSERAIRHCQALSCPEVFKQRQTWTLVEIHLLSEASIKMYNQFALKIEAMLMHTKIL